MNAELKRLEQIAESISDGEPVDWEKIERTQAAFETTLRMQQLKILEAIADEHRALHQDHPTVWKHLRVLESIGRGSFGEVFRAHDPGLQHDVALKLLHQTRGSEATENETFVREARILARVRHKNVLVIHGVDQDHGRFGLWTELIEGETLEQILSTQGVLGAQEAASIGMDVCRALAAVHAAGLVHGDVKCANIMRERGGRVVLMDFSSVREKNLSAGSQTESASGTPIYMAPELFKGADRGRAADVYSLGVVLYRLVSGRYPVPARSVEQLREMHGRQATIPLRDVRPDLPAAYVQVVERALATDPAQRYATAGAMEQALGATFVPASAGHFTAATASGSAISRRRLLAFVAAAALVAVAVAYTLWPVPVQPSGEGLLALRAPWKVEATWSVQGPPDREIQSGFELRSDAMLYLEVEASRSLHAYVLNEDSNGDLWLLFPRPGLAEGNPLGGGHHRLPEPGGSWNRSTASRGEILLAVAAPEPLEFFEQIVSAAAAPEPDQPGAPVLLSGEQRKAIYRGFGEIRRTAPSLTEIERRLTEIRTDHPKLFMKKIELPGGDAQGAQHD